MNTESIIERYIIDEFMMGESQAKIGLDDPLIESGIVDSLGLIRLISFLEESFGITVEDTEIVPDNFQTINSIKALIEPKMQQLNEAK